MIVINIRKNILNLLMLQRIGSVAAIIFFLTVTPFLSGAASLAGDQESNSAGSIIIAPAQTQGEDSSRDSGSDTVEDLEAVEDIDEKDTADGGETLTIADPLQPWNRVWYHFNDRLYFWVLKPLSQGYRLVVPEGLRVSFNNFYTNATAPVRILNSLFQLKVNHAAREFSRFFINTTMGFVGFRDCALDCYGIREHDEDFGQTLGHYGMGHGFYLVWPFFGPSSARDSLGRGADSFLSFTGYFGPFDLETSLWVGIKSHEVVNATSLRIGDYETFKKAALDPYTAMRDGYAQRRKKAVQE